LVIWPLFGFVVNVFNGVLAHLPEEFDDIEGGDVGSVVCSLLAVSRT